MSDSELMYRIRPADCTRAAIGRRDARCMTDSIDLWKGGPARIQEWAATRMAFQFCGSSSANLLIGVAAMRPSTSRR